MQTAPQSNLTSTIVGQSPWAVSIRKEIEIVGRHAATVLITGPSGTGKELVARSIHEVSDRKDRPFVPIDCASATGTLFASQLFGHVKGAFTGASAEAMGAFRAADGGTIFLDELGELNLELQASLLRVLQERVVVPLGGLRESPVDVRVVAATNRDLCQEVASGRFREDLFYRLNVAVLRTVPLRERLEDIPELVRVLMARLQVKHGVDVKTLTGEAYAVLVEHDWPGNVRELNNVLERALLYCDAKQVERDHLPAIGSGRSEPRTRADSEKMATPADCWPTMAELQRRHIERTLERTGFNQTAAARLLGIDRHALRRSIRRLGVDLTVASRD